MQLTLEVQSGPDAGKRLTLQAGQTALVGRASWADLSVGGDSALSGRHFTVACEEHRCVLRDYKGSNGTSLNGGKVAESLLRDGDRIVAGETTFVISVGDVPPPVVVPPVATSTAPSAKPRDLLALLQAAQPLYALLDAARDDKVLALLKAAPDEYASLFEGEQGEELAAFAPYLVRLEAGSALLKTVTKQGWGKSWGVFLTCDRPLPEVRKHFRHFLLARHEGGQEVYFRFYDPRVLRLFLPTCNRLEVKEFFGPIQSFWVEDQEPQILLHFSLDRADMKQAAISLQR